MPFIAGISSKNKRIITAAHWIPWESAGLTMINSRESRQHIVKKSEEKENLEGMIGSNIESALERLLAPIVQVERLKRREYLTPEEVEAVYGLKAATLANKRSKAQGPEYIKDGDRILYRQQAIKIYLDARAIKTRT